MLARWILHISVLAATILASAGCVHLQSQMGLLEETAPTSKLSSRKLRVLLTDYVPRFATGVEQCADRILAEASDVEVRRNALLWKSNAISACFSAAARHDPLAAYLDVWILNRQMTQYFEQTSAAPVFGNWQPLALATSRELEAPLEQIQSMLDANASNKGKFVEEFTRLHPITSLYFERASLAAPFIEDIRDPARDVANVVAEFSEDLGEIQRLSALYAEFVPKQARWQAELLFLSAADDTGLLSQPLQSMAVASQAMDRLASTFETIPQIVEREHNAVRELIQDERSEVIHRIDQMRNTTVADLRLEGAELLRTIHDERTAFDHNLHEVVGRSLEKADKLVCQRGRELGDAADRVAKRVWQQIVHLSQVGGMIILACVVAIALARRLLNARRRPSRHARPVRTDSSESQQHAQLSRAA
jgi:hypothetical protein